MLKALFVSVQPDLFSLSSNESLLYIDKELDKETDSDSEVGFLIY